MAIWSLAPACGGGKTAAPLSAAKELTSFAFLPASNADLAAEVTGAITGASIALTVPHGTEVASLAPTITHTGAGVSPASGVLQDFTDPVAYTVTAADGTTKVYTVTVSVALDSAKDITEFAILGVNGTIGEDTISLTVPYGTALTALTPTTVSITGESVSPAAGASRDFTSPVVYTVTAADGTTKDYTVTVTVALDSSKDITQFAILGVNGTIGEDTISVTVPYGTALTALTPTITATGESVSPASEVARDFSSPVTYVVTAEDASVKSYTVTVTVAPGSHVATLTSGTYTVSAGGTASESIVDVSFGTSKDRFLAALTKGESHQTWNDMAISDPVVTGDALVVTAQDGTTTVTYLVTARTEYVLRDTGPAGGLIFHVNQNHEGDGWRYLEAAPGDQSAGIRWRNGTDNVVTGATGTAVGTGRANTAAIVSAQGAGSYAAQVCDDLSEGSYDDWFLPSRDELNLMYVELKAHGLGGFNGSAGYWSSSELDFQTAAYQGFSGGGQSWNYKHSTYPVRAARAFAWSYVRAFDYTGGEQQWIVPAGVTSIHVDVRGAQGAGPSENNGARVQTTLVVTPGEALHVFVGGTDGYNGGGISFYLDSFHNGGGGSDIRQAGTGLGDRVVVAGGGGGWGYGGNYGGTNGHGGAGGYDGASGYGCGGCDLGGGGGTQSAGGVGGAAYYGGSSGSLGVGGNAVDYYGGGGGGGGYYGGGGGGGGNGGGGGGGGSSNSRGTSTTYTDGYQSGNGQIIITY